MPMAFKTFSSLHSTPQPPGDTTEQIAVSSLLVSSTKWALRKKKKKKHLFKNFPCKEFCAISAFCMGNMLTRTLVIKAKICCFQVLAIRIQTIHKTLCLKHTHKKDENHKGHLDLTLGRVLEVKIYW
jgi:hypothetical protein